MNVTDSKMESIIVALDKKNTHKLNVEEENVVGQQRGEYYIQSPISEMKINCPNHHLLSCSSSSTFAVGLPP